MIVYVESNFVLELAFLQEDHESCLALLGMAEAGDLDLVLPAYSVGEPYEVWVRRSKQRRELHNRLRTELGELARSKPYQGPSADLRELLGILVESGEEEKGRLDQALDRIAKVATLIPISGNTLRAAIAFQKNPGLSPQDAIVYASVLDHLTSAAPGLKCFITKNAKDFVSLRIRDELAAYDCRLLTRFRDGLGYARSQSGT